jgi:Flp pilus assembly pilin Flp
MTIPGRTDVTARGAPKPARRDLLRDARGVTQAEYAVLFVVMVVGTIGAWFGFGADLADAFVEQEQPTNSAAYDHLSRRLDNVGGPSVLGQQLAEALDPESFVNEATAIVQGAADELMEIPGAALGAAQDIVNGSLSTIQGLPETAAAAAGKALGESLQEAGIPTGGIGSAFGTSNAGLPDVSGPGAAGSVLGILAPKE